MVGPNAVIGSFWARLMSLTNEQRGAVKGFLEPDTGFLAGMKAKFPDLTKFVQYTQEHCRDASTTCDAHAVGIFNYTDSDGNAISGASEATRFYDTLV